VYKNPQNQEVLQVQLSVPILDWGRSIRAPKQQWPTTAYRIHVEQDKQNFQQQIVTQVSLFNVMKEQLDILPKLQHRLRKYQIASEAMYLRLSITDLGIAFAKMTRPSAIT